ncbi:MAG: hypothetical protein EOP22_11770 [Hyphomicrobiales bacterium]|nr:MAG: hypothetical protein EOP22_11770 [Hyphomicrobiales bacterium]
MTTADFALGSPPQRKPFIRTATAIVWLVALAAFLAVAQHVINAGFLRRDIEALLEGEAWRTGGWLSQLVLVLVSFLHDVALEQTVLSLTAAVFAGLSFGILYDRLRLNGWAIVGTIAMLAALGVHAHVLYAITASSRGFPLYFALAAIIPAIRQMEKVGDVQSTIGLGLLMPLVLLAGPLTTPLILPLALGAALADPDGRRDPRAFVAMLLVALIPALIVAIGVVGFVAQSGLGVELVLLPYIATYGALQMGDVVASMGAMFTFAPVAVVPILYCVWPNLPEKRHVWSALAVIALPLYLAVARTIFTTPMEPFVPAIALLAAFISWLCVVRLPFPLRALALLTLVLAAALSWTQTGIWDDPAWKAALFDLPMFSNLMLRPGV